MNTKRYIIEISIGEYYHSIHDSSLVRTNEPLKAKGYKTLSGAQKALDGLKERFPYLTTSARAIERED